jgi:acyl carrier protein
MSDNSCEEITKNILKFIHDTFPRARQKNAMPNDFLLEQRFIDSMGLLDVIVFVENTYKISINNEDVTNNNFATVQNIAEYVQRNLEKMKRDN